MELTKEQRTVVMKILQNTVESGNYGMFAKTQEVSFREHHMLMDNGIRFKGDIITKNDKAIYLVKRRYSNTKRDGMYKELTPRLINMTLEHAQGLRDPLN